MYALLVSLCVVFTLTAQAQQDRITGRITNGSMVVLRGHVPGRALRAENQGPVAASFVLPSVTMHLAASTTQEAALRQLLASQQDPSSANYHKWLTPEQYANQFGVSPSDMGRIRAWLESQGLQVGSVARSRTWIRFSGTAAQVGTALHTQVNQYLEDGTVHYSNASDPSIPAALAGMVQGFRGLNDFHRKPRYIAGPRPADNFQGQNQIAPDDFATIYDVTRLYNQGIDGTGMKLVVVGQTQINLSDIEAFRSQFGLPVNDPQLILVQGSGNPGFSQGDLPEANLDLEWSGAVARKAQIIYVYSDDVDTSATDAVDNAYAPIISMSYGLCENNDLIDLPMEESQALQANAEGITWFGPAGDSGAGDCEDSGAIIAQDGFAVDAPGSVPEVTSMGGLEFNEGNGNYWSLTNTATSASALSYIPERVWNDSELGFGLAAGGGGTSIFFPKPAWQTGPGVPNTSYRNVPDVSISASADHDGYVVYTSGQPQIYGGTSVAVPTMAGIVTLLNQYLVSTGALAKPGLANINPELYRLGQNVSGVFHDTTVGNNSLPCVAGSPDCVNGFFGYNAAAGYDRASGLGSPDAYNLVHAWTGQDVAEAVVTASIDQNPVFEQLPDVNGNRWQFTITLSDESGVSATVTNFAINGQSYNVNTVFGTTSIPANGSIPSIGLGANVTIPSGGSTNVEFTYSGTDAQGHQWSGEITIPFTGPQVPLIVGGVSNAASGQQAYAPGMLASVYGTALGDAVQTAGTIPLPQYLQGFEAEVGTAAVTAPLYYVSPDQVNLQIPYETPLGTQTLTVGNPYINVNVNIQVVAAAPGIFVENGFIFPPYNTAGQGKETALYITGAGVLSPSVETGDAPTTLTNAPKPILPVTVTVANQNAEINFVGTTPGLVGVVQVNFTVPAGVPTGVQPVVVTVGTAASPPANLMVTQ
ncbi:MAG TPA: protease pro-enzyme activation domain-containing protein [Bryobacteraceae bacterium]|nr:protease pro-enzyme activation domain-containing protein [Bryobacteraceae bacterium]